MIVEVQYTTDCPNARPVMQRIKERADSRSDLQLILTEVRFGEPTPDGFCGSPTVLIDGRNLFGGVPIDSAACAVSPPTTDQVDAAISA